MKESSTKSYEQYLTDDDILIISKPLARCLGVSISIVFRRLAHWLHNNEKIESRYSEDQRRHYKDGIWWSYNTYEEWNEDFGGIWSTKTIERTFLFLEELGLVVSNDKYNKWEHDRTKWYSIDYVAYEAFMSLWEEMGAPIFNGGKKSPEYQAFLDKWEQIRTNLPTRQLVVTVTTTCRPLIQTTCRHHYQ